MIVIAITLGALTWVNYRFSVQNPGGNDFLAKWMGAEKWLKEGLSPYDPRVSRETQALIYGHPADPSKGEDINHFVYPMYSMVFFAPFVYMDFTLARAIWMTLLEVTALGTIWLGLRLVDWRPSFWMTALLVLFSVIWYHGARTIILGQPSMLVAFLTILSLYLIKQKQDTAAGAILVFATIKPQMVFLLVPFVFLWAYSVRRFRIITGFLITFAIAMAITLALVPSWPMQMIGQMLEYPSYVFTISPLATIAEFFPGIQPLFGQALHAVAYLYLLVQWINAWQKDERWFLWTALMTLVVTHLTAFRTASTNFVVLLPALLLVFRIMEQRWKGIGKGVVVGMMLVLLAGLWWLFVLTIVGNQESQAMFLPVPLFLFAALWWSRWYALRPQKLMLEEMATRFR